MDSNYQILYEKVKALGYQIHDVVDNRNHPIILALNRELQALLDDIETGKRPRSVEDRVEHIQQLLMDLRAHGDEAMSYQHIDYFHRCFEEMRAVLRKFSNY